MEVQRKGHIEYRELKDPRGTGLFFASIADTETIGRFLLFAEAAYGRFLPGASVLVNFAIYNARDMHLGIGGEWPSEREQRRWRKQHLELESIFVPDIQGKTLQLLHTICDLLWNAFHYERADIFDEQGNIRYR